MKYLFIALILGYQKTFRSLTAGSCRHEPSCSDYNLEALKKYGTIKGLYLGTARILRCRPGGSWGMDSVPEKWPGWGFRGYGNRQKP